MAESQPAIPVPPPLKWNVSYDGGAAVGYPWGLVGHPPRSIAQQFIDALSERVAAAHWHRGPWPGGRPRLPESPLNTLYEYEGFLYSAAVPAPTALPALGFPGPNAPLVVATFNIGRHPHGEGFWSRLQRKVALLLGAFLGPADVDDGLGLGALTLPPDAFRRKFPREIWSLSNPGASGQVARFAVHLGSQDTQAEPVELFPGVTYFPVVTTPEAEREHSGKIFQHDGAAWRLAEDQSLRPDVVSKHGFAQEGDTFGPWIPADIRAQMHRMAEQFASERPTPVFDNELGSRYEYLSMSIADTGDAYCKAGWPDFIQTWTQGDDPYKFFGGLPRPGAVTDQFVPNKFRVRYRVFSDRLAMPPGGAGCECRGYVWCEEYMNINLGPHGTFAPFNTFGDPGALRRWTTVAEPAMAHGEFRSSQVGTLEQDLPDGFEGYWGYIGLRLNWGVDGGFVYSPLRND